MGLLIEPPPQDLTHPVIAIDGLARTGTSTAMRLVAKALGFRTCDSGALFRAVALLGHRQNVLEDVNALRDIALALRVEENDDHIILHGIDETEGIRTGAGAAHASQIAVHLPVREALRTFQLRKREEGPLVTDGRDVCWVYNTKYRFYLFTDVHVKAARHFAYLQSTGVTTFSKTAIFNSIVDRDHRDTHREHNPARQHPEAFPIDTSLLPREGAAEIILEKYRTNMA
ncbi:MAG: hypothetical protein RJB39_396 [Candidatus Parcubacteria bacterium]|jgi:cytidylate kinase